MWIFIAIEVLTMVLCVMYIVATFKELNRMNRARAEYQRTRYHAGTYKVRK